MSEAKCSVCGATPMESEDIYEDIYGENRHRHLNQCIGYLKTRNVDLSYRVVKLEEGLLTVKNIIVRWNSESDFDDGGLLELIEGVLK